MLYLLYSGRPTSGKTPIINPNINKAARQQQIKRIEEVINSKFSGNTEKMRSIWEKAPQLPITQAGFRVDVVGYADSPAGAKYEDTKRIAPNDPATNMNAGGPGKITNMRSFGEISVILR